jgi:hypothetical protein
VVLPQLGPHGLFIPQSDSIIDVGDTAYDNIIQQQASHALATVLQVGMKVPRGGRSVKCRTTKTTWAAELLFQSPSPASLRLCTTLKSDKRLGKKSPLSSYGRTELRVGTLNHCPQHLRYNVAKAPNTCIRPAIQARLTQ